METVQSSSGGRRACFITVLVSCSSFGAFPLQSVMKSIYLRELPTKCLRNVLEILGATCTQHCILNSQQLKRWFEKHRSYFLVEAAGCHKQQRGRRTTAATGIGEAGARAWAQPRGLSPR